MIKQIIAIGISAVLIMTGCSSKNISNNNSNNNNNKKEPNLIYSNLIDKKTQNEVRDILIENKIDKKQADYLIKLVQNYNKISNIKKLDTSKQGYASIGSLQVPYDEAYLGEKWDYNKLNYSDFNCRLTAFTIFKDYIKSEGKSKDENSNLMFDLDAIENNPISNFSKEDVDKFINLYASIPVENSKDTNKLVESIKKEWKNRKISFVDNPTVSIVSGFLHYPEDKQIFIGHVGISIETKNGLLFVEKYGASLPIQVSKFKDKSELKSYLMDRLDVNTADNGAAKPIIMENDELMK